MLSCRSIGNSIVSSFSKPKEKYKDYYLSQSQDSLLGSNATSLDHDKVLLDQTVVGETTHGIDGLVSQIIIGSGVVLHQLKIKQKHSKFVQKTRCL